VRCDCRDGDRALAESITGGIGWRPEQGQEADDRQWCHLFVLVLEAVANWPALGRFSSELRVGGKVGL
jgi:hypothetical protein